MGMGNPIDFEPPILTLYPLRNPLYVNQDTVIRGTVTDNVAVDRVIAIERRDDGTERPLGKAVISGIEWSMTLDVTIDDNGRRFSVEIIAYDKVGNTGEESMAVITVIVDIRKPIFKDVTIWRSPTRFAKLESLSSLKALETSDPDARRPQNVDRYQNGVFRIAAQITDDDTSIDADTVELLIYDASPERGSEGMELYRKNIWRGSQFTPEWLITEQELVQAGDSRGWGYDSALENNGRLYFRVEIHAKDMAQNMEVLSEFYERELIDDIGFFVVFRRADTPKAISNANIRIVGIGAALPIDIFDDDTIDVAYAGLLTAEQFAEYGRHLDNHGKLAVLRQKLEAYRLDPINNEPVYNWKVDIYKEPGDPPQNIAENMIVNLASSGPMESIPVTILTGSNEARDYGDYVLFAIAKDLKDDLHFAESIVEEKYKEPKWVMEAFDVTIADRNSPIIVLDTTTGSIDTLGEYASTGNSPEENTFPNLEIITDVQGNITNAYFTLNGYTLDENSRGRGRVEEFKIAWIPYLRAGYQEDIIDDVKDAIKLSDPSMHDNYGNFTGVQWWNFTELISYNNETSYFIQGTDENIAGSNYTKQVFKKRFDILGGQDDLNPSYNNFHNNGVLENDPKVFVFYAKDLDGNVTYRTIRILGNRSPPSLNIYDLTSLAIEAAEHAANNGSNTLLKQIIIDGAAISSSSQEQYFDEINALPRTENELMTETFRAYANGTVLVLLADADVQGGLPITSFKLGNRTAGAPAVDLPHGTGPDKRVMTYIIKMDSAVQQIIFIFDATNALGESAAMQRTVTVANTAILDEISAEQPSGTYPFGKTINFRARFSNEVRVTSNNNLRPRLVIRYEAPVEFDSGSKPTSSAADLRKKWVYDYVDYSGNLNEPLMYLDFNWSVPEGVIGKLETFDVTGNGKPAADGVYDRPIYLPTGVQIEDATSTHIPAFLPGYSSGITWSAGKSLQGSDVAPKKNIQLDGLRPRLERIDVSGKNSYADGKYYFKDGETITFTLRMQDNALKLNNNRIREGFGYINTEMLNPRLVFNVVETGGNTIGPYMANFSKPDGSQALAFEIPVSSIPTGNFTAAARTGKIVITGLNTDQGNIVDPVNNTLDITGITTMLADDSVRIDKRNPGPSTPTINDAAIPNAWPALNTYNGQPVLRLPPADGVGVEPWGVDMEYSLDGAEWQPYPNPRAGWTHANSGDGLIINSGKWKLSTRQVDKAGNQGVAYTYNLDIKGEFPVIESILALNTDGFYIPNYFNASAGRITIALDFKHNVKTTAHINESYIVVADAGMDLSALNSAISGMNATQIKTYCDSRTDVDIINPLPVTLANGSSRLEFHWRPMTPWGTRKEMANGITVAKIKLSGGVEDVYGNPGEDSISAAAYPNGVYMAHTNEAGDAANYTRTNLNGGGIKVFTIPPRLIDSVPKNAGTAEVDGGKFPSSVVLDGDRTTITLTFNSAMQKGMGKIIIKPRECDGNHIVNNEYVSGAHTAACVNMIPIPPVFPVEEYYEFPDGTKSPNQNGAGTGVHHESFYQVYSRMDAAGKTAMMRARIGTPGQQTQSESGAGTYEDPALDSRTGLYAGPYKLTTQGLTPGAGYAASNTAGRTMLLPSMSTGDTQTPNYFYMDNTTQVSVDNPGWYREGTATDTNPYMVPDITGKFVLDYQFGISETVYTYGSTGNLETGTVIHPATNDNTVWNYANTATPRRDVILNIRNALSRAKYRWQEIEVASGNVTINTVGDSKIVTVTLESALPKGMRWDIAWTDGALSNAAGVPVELESNWWFWTDGVQAPVIRVDRRSVDHRTEVNKVNNNKFTRGAPPSFALGGATAANFATINYRIESETPGAVLTYGTITGDVNNGMGITAAWTGNIEGTGTAYSWITFPNNTAQSGGMTVNDTTGSTTRVVTAVDPGTWLRPNLIRKSITATWTGGNGGNAAFGLHYYEKEGAKIVKRQGIGGLRIIRSYNKDAKRDDLNAVAESSPITNNRQSSFTGLPLLRASKNYIAAKAEAPHDGTNTAIGYEGAFRTVVMLNNANDGSPNGEIKYFNKGDNPMVIGASNLPNGSPSVPGFPVQTGAGDLRYYRVMYLDNNSNNNILWISTEIVSPAYYTFFAPQNQSDLLAQTRSLFGDSGAYLTGGYGELTYSYQQDVKN